MIYIANNNHASHSLWYATRTGETGSSPLDRSAIADTCVIGAGIAGLASAYQLAREGRDVIVVDDGDIGGGETGRSTAHLSSAIDDRFFRLESIHGEVGARICHASHAAAIEWYASLIAREDIDCEFERVDGYLFRPPGESDEIITRELTAAHRAGATNASLVARAPLVNYDTGVAIRFPHQAQCDPLALVLGIAGACHRMGVRIHCGTNVESIDANRVVRCRDGATIQANSVIVATNSPINNLMSLPLRQHAYRTYALAVPITRGAIPLALFWDTTQKPGDTGGPYHFARLQRRDPALTPDDAAAEILIVGGEDHKTGQANDAEQRWGRLAQWANERFPVAGPICAKWSGQIMEPIDGVAYIGRSPGAPDGVYVITGDSGMGITHAAIGAMIITDQIAGRTNPWEALYDPTRKTLASLPKFAGENLNTAAQYFDWLTPGDVSSTSEIAPGEGAVMRRGLKILACYRDEEGSLHERSAICPHLGGIVHWNSAESSWDCPCHGSRFSATGEVVNGPATAALSKVEDTGATHARA